MIDRWGRPDDHLVKVEKVALLDRRSRPVDDVQPFEHQQSGFDLANQPRVEFQLLPLPVIMQREIRDSAVLFHLGRRARGPDGPPLREGPQQEDNRCALAQRCRSGSCGW
ncbi:MAG: hypothetical protein EA424_13295 [Planctomycetaceae bacterium]|nr:MAG: hypothetical protein EA424_13295 [Planctomycetaceae bacterium]